MALLRFEGFDIIESAATDGADNKTLSHKQMNIDTASTLNRVAGRYSGYAVSLNSANDSIYIPVTEKTSFVFGVWCYFDTLPGTNSSFIELRDYTGNAQLTIQATSAGAIRILRGSVTLLNTSSSGVLVVDTWHRFEGKITIDNSSGSYELRIDESVVLSGSGVDTQQTANSVCSQVTLTCGVNTLNYDDFYYLDSTVVTGHPTDYLGDWAVETTLMASDAGTNDFAPTGAGSSNADRISEEVSDEDTTYVEATTAGSEDLYNPNTLRIGANSIAAIQLFAKHRKTLPSIKTGRTKIVSGVTTDNGDTEGVPSSYAYTPPKILVQDPDTSAAWTRDGLNASVIGYEIVT